MNVENRAFQSYLTGIEIGKVDDFKRLREERSNRTLLELKYTIILTVADIKWFQSYLTGIEICFRVFSLQMLIMVPIVPYWN